MAISPNLYAPRRWQPRTQRHQLLPVYTPVGAKFHHVCLMSVFCCALFLQPWSNPGHYEESCFCYLSDHSLRRCNEVCAAIGLPPVEAKHRSTHGAEGGIGGAMMMGGGPGVGVGGPAEFRMGGGLGMTMPMQKMMERMMQQMLRGHLGGKAGGNVQVLVNGGGGGGGGGGGRQRRVGVQGGAEALGAALKASKDEAAAEEERNLRAALAASGSDSRSAGRGGGVGALQAALRASERTAAEEEQRNLRAALAVSGGNRRQR